MWEIPRYRIRAYLRSVQKTRVRDKQKLARSTFHFKRVRTELRVGDGFNGPTTVIQARTVLNDMGLRGVKVFTSVPLQPGMELAITIEQPRYFYVRGIVRYCHEVSMDSRVLSATPFNYRVYIQFRFNSMAEELAVESYCQQLFAENLASPGIRSA